jgi:hypothetical protein
MRQARSIHESRLAPGCPTHSRVSNVWDQESVELLALPLIPNAGMSGAPSDAVPGLITLAW